MSGSSAIFAVCAIALFIFAARAETSELPRSQSESNKTTHVRVTFDASGKVIIESNSIDGAWLWDPATRTASTIADFMTQVRPVGGTEVVITKQSRCAARVAIPVDASGTAMLPSDLEDGSYNLRVHIPQATYMANVPPETSSHSPAIRGDMDVRFTLFSSSGKIENMAINERAARGFNLPKAQSGTDKRC